MVSPEDNCSHAPSQTDYISDCSIASWLSLQSSSRYHHHQHQHTAFIMHLLLLLLLLLLKSVEFNDDIALGVAGLDMGPHVKSTGTLFPLHL